jgi:membrane protein
VIVFLVWLWITNLAVLLGAELHAELAHVRVIEGGEPEDRSPFLPPRDTRAMTEDERSAVVSATEQDDRAE